MADYVPRKQVAFLAAECEAVCGGILKDLDISADLDPNIFRQLTTFFLRDIYRIDQQQRGSVSLAKHSGYWAFWIRKLKPISRPKMGANSFLDADDLDTINEVVAIFFAIQLVVEMRRSNQNTDMVRRECVRLQGADHCDGVDCFNRYIARYIKFEDKFFLKSLCYSMSKRTFGPHHFAFLVEGLVYSSCEPVRGS